MEQVTHEVTPKSAGDSELVRVVAVADGVKRVVFDAFRVQLLARNALVQAQRAGAQARGFSEVSRHMGTLSRELDEGMRGLWEQSADWVRAVCALLRERRSSRYLVAALASVEAAPSIEEARARAVARREKLVREVAAARTALSDRFDEVDRLATMGCVLARSARIEATYGGNESDGRLLSDLSQDFARTADVIYSSLKALRKQVAG